MTGVDLTPEFIDVGRELNVRVGLDRHIELRQGDARRLPFDDGRFDVAWTQHVAMNIPDKQAFYRELRRVLRPGGRVALFDFVAGTGDEPVRFPVPWASSPEQSHLVSPDDVVGLVEAAGFGDIRSEDPTEEAVAFLASMGDGPAPPVNIALLVGPDLPEKAANVAAGFSSGALRLLRLVATAR